MKKIYIFILFVVSSLLYFSCSSEQKEMEEAETATITGQVTNPYTDSVWVRKFNTVGNALEINSASVLDSAGRFKITLNLEEPNTYQFFDGNEVTSLYVSPGDNLNLTLDTKEFDESIEYTGTGSTINNYLKSRYLQFDDNKAFDIYGLRNSLDIDQGIRLVDSLQKLRIQFLNNYVVSHPDIDDVFINLEKTNIEFEFPNKIMLFTYNRPDRDTSLTRLYELLGSYIQREPLDINSGAYLTYLNYSYPTFLRRKNKEQLLNVDMYDSVMLQLIATGSDGYAREYMLTQNFLGKIKDGNPEFYEKYKYVAEEYIKRPDLREAIRNEYVIMAKLMNQPMPKGAKLINLEHVKYSDVTFQQILDKYKGTVVYLDFWASWCGPCKAEMPASQKLQKYFSDKDVSFVYFSSDRDSLAWKKAIKMLSISGEHYRLSKEVKKETNTLFNVRYIPRYVIFDKTGKVVNDNAKRPSDPDLIPDLEMLLK